MDPPPAQRTRSLRQRLALYIGLMVVGCLLLAIGAIIGVTGLHQDFGIALQGYRQLKQVYDIGVHVAAAGDALRARRPDARKALNALQSAAMKLEAAPFAGDGG